MGLKDLWLERRATEGFALGPRQVVSIAHVLCAPEALHLRCRAFRSVGTKNQKFLDGVRGKDSQTWELWDTLRPDLVISRSILIEKTLSETC